jgi:cell division protein FtsB
MSKLTPAKQRAQLRQRVKTLKSELDALTTERRSLEVEIRRLEQQLNAKTRKSVHPEAA